MAKKRNRKSKCRKRNQTGQTSHASLAGFAPLIGVKGDIRQNSSAGFNFPETAGLPSDRQTHFCGPGAVRRV